ncbi:MAG: porin family protein [Rhodobacteraceae bacterium]|nr:porin family protein [Paracoccaceae bacterium]
MVSAVKSRARGPVKNAFAALFFLSSSSIAVSAADLDRTRSVDPWSGLYVGGMIGGGAVIHELDVPAAPALATLNGIGGEAFVGGVMAGINHRLWPRVVVGAQFDATFNTDQVELTAPGINADISADVNFAVSARLGYLLSERTMAYMIGGLSYSEFDLRASTPIGGINVNVADVFGAHVGAGIETILSGSWKMRAEYRYTSYEEESLILGLVGVQPSSHVGMIGVSYDFYNPPAGPSQSFGYAAGLPTSADKNWSGVYLGALIGGTSVVHEVSTPALGGITFDGVGGEGVLGGGMVGANWQVSPEFVLGAQIDGNFNSDLTEASVVGGLFNATLTNEYLVAFSGRAGVLIQPEALAYLIGGYSLGEFELNTSGALLPPGGFKINRNVDGFHVGAGLEAAINENWTVRAEYRFTQFGKESFAGGLVSVEPSMHAGQIGVAYNFNVF